MYSVSIVVREEKSGFVALAFVASLVFRRKRGPLWKCKLDLGVTSGPLCMLYGIERLVGVRLLSLRLFYLISFSVVWLGFWSSTVETGGGGRCGRVIRALAGGAAGQRADGFAWPMKARGSASVAQGRLRSISWR